MALEEKITKYPVAASEFRTHDLSVASPTPYPLSHPDFCIGQMEKKNLNLSKQYYVIRKRQRLILFV